MKIYLKEQRLLKGFSQKEVASYINTEVSNYNRKENGQVKITRNEWERLAEFLECAVEDIYQTEDVSKYKGKNFSGNIGDFNNNTYHGINEFSFEILKKYIIQLEAEIKHLKSIIDKGL